MLKHGAELGVAPGGLGCMLEGVPRSTLRRGICLGSGLHPRIWWPFKSTVITGEGGRVAVVCLATKWQSGWVGGQQAVGQNKSSWHPGLGRSQQAAARMQSPAPPAQRGVGTGALGNGKVGAGSSGGSAMGCPGTKSRPHSP